MALVGLSDAHRLGWLVRALLRAVLMKSHLVTPGCPVKAADRMCEGSGGIQAFVDDVGGM